MVYDRESIRMGSGILTSKLFASMAFSVCALIFLVLILIMYISKRRQHKSQSNGYLYLLVFTICLLISEMAYVYCMSIMDQIPLLTKIFTH